MGEFNHKDQEEYGGNFTKSRKDTNTEYPCRGEETFATNADNKLGQYEI
jgi:hypothetical protein